MSLMGLLGKHGGGVEVPSAEKLDKVSAYRAKQVRGLGDTAYDKTMFYHKNNPYDAAAETAQVAESRKGIESQRAGALEDLNERGMKGAYNSGLMEKLRKSTNRTYDDASIEAPRRAKLDFIGRRTAFDMDLLDRTNQMAQFGSQQQLNNIWNRLRQKQAQAQSGMQFAKDVFGMVGGAGMGGAPV